MQLSKTTFFSFMLILVIGIVGIPVTIYSFSQNHFLISSHAYSLCASTHWQVVRTSSTSDNYGAMTVSLYDLIDDQGAHCHEFYTFATETLRKPVNEADSVVATIQADAPSLSQAIIAGQTVHLTSKAFTTVTNCAKGSAALIENSNSKSLYLPLQTKGLQTQIFCEK